MTDVFIDIKSTQADSEKTEAIELSAVGKLILKDGAWLLSYEDEVTVEAAKVKTSIKVDSPCRAVMLHSGGVSNKMVFEKNKRTLSLYSVAGGSLCLGVYCKEISHSLNSEGGKIVIKYSLDIENAFISDNTIEINIRRIENKNADS